MKLHINISHWVDEWRSWNIWTLDMDITNFEMALTSDGEPAFNFYTSDRLFYRQRNDEAFKAMRPRVQSLVVQPDMVTIWLSLDEAMVLSPHDGDERRQMALDYLFNPPRRGRV